MNRSSREPGLAGVLVVNRDPQMRVALQKALFVAGIQSTIVDGEAEARAVLGRDGISATVVAIESPSSLELLRSLALDSPGSPVLAVAQAATAELVRDVLRAGASDFLFGPSVGKRLASALESLTGVEPDGSPTESASLPEDPSPESSRESPSGVHIISSNPKTRRLLRIAEKIAPTDATVLVEGESGTGKELVARWIHEHSPRASRPFVDVNCGALPENLLESQLFGHEKGSFTGAVQRQVGLFEVADRGTIFLDEIGEMSPAMQVKLLRVLQSREFRRIGGSQIVKVDVRVIAATNRALKSDVEAGRFRRDLYYRINVIALELPPLRERRDEIPGLVESFCEKIAREEAAPRKSFSPPAIETLQKLRWEGNVRELENVVERLILLSSADVVDVDDVEEHLGSQQVDVPLESDFATSLSLDEVKRIHIGNVLRENGGNKMRSARVLKINVKTLYNLIRSLDIQW